MTELQTLDRNLRRISNDVARMQKPVDRAHGAVRGTRSVLAKPRQLARAMKWIASKAKSMRYTALFLMPFPVIGTLASRIARILHSVRRTAERVRRAAEKTDRKIKPAKSAVAKVDPPVTKAKRSLDRAQALLQGWLAITVELERRFGDTPPDDVDDACARINRLLAPELETIVKQRAALGKGLDGLSAGFEGVTKASRPVLDALAAGEDLVASLRPIEGPLRELNKALKPVRWALDAVSWVTRKIIDPVVNEILKAVGLDRLVRKLERSLNPLARLAAPLERALGPLERSVAKLRSTAKVVAGLERIPQMERRIVAAMRPLARLAS